MVIPARKNTDKALLYRWGIVGIVLAAGLSMWYAKTSGRTTAAEKTEWLKNYVKIACPRCGNEDGKRENCSLCNGRGFIWVDKTREDIPEEVSLPK